MIVLRYVLQSAIGLFGLVIVILGIVALTKGDFTITNTRGWDAAFIPFGLLIIAEAIYFLVRRIPRVTDGGERERTPKEESIDTLVIIGIFVVGAVVAMIVGLTVR